MSFSVLIETLDPVVLSAHVATEAMHESLRHIPGSALLGMAAAQLYGTLDVDAAQAMFHAGRVRFGDGLPLTPDGRIGYPMPLSLHVPKRQKPSFKAGANVRNDAVADRQASSEQHEQLRGGFITLDGDAFEVRTRSVTKTAVDAQTGRAKDGQLFAYEAIDAGQRFLCRVDTPAGFDEGRLRAAFEGVRLLGRSRSAEFGRVRMQVREDTFDVPASPDATPGRLTLWCLSPLALVDAWGQPTLQVTGSAIGVPQATLDVSRSFLRSGRVSRFNQHRHAYDPEQAVIARGSVLVFNNVPADAVIPAAVGESLGLGFGRVAINPACLAGESFRVLAEPQRIAAAAAASRAAPSPLVDWLRAQSSSGEGDRQQRVKRAGEELERRYVLARKEARSSSLPIGPSRSQWQGVGEIARTVKALADVQREFLSGKGPCKRDGKGWKDVWYDDEAKTLQSFHAWFAKYVSGLVEKGASDALEELREFAREAVRISEQHQGGQP